VALVPNMQGARQGPLPNRLADQGRLEEAYGRLQLAICWTAGRAHEQRKVVPELRWQKTPRQSGPVFARGLLERCERANPAAVMHRSGLLGLDEDGPEGARLLRELAPDLPATVTVTTGRPDGGRHLWFRGSAHTPGVVQLADDGVTPYSEKYLMIPPSIHPSGAVYSFAPGRAPWEIEVAELPPATLERILGARTNGTVRPSARRLRAAAGQPVAAGRRNDHLFGLACAIRHWGCEEAVVLAALEAENSARCQPPLDIDEVSRIAHSASRYEPVGADCHTTRVTGRMSR
jgi:hypothetical protein